jgi:deferrochelatase/peroxidase EfeB
MPASSFEELARYPMANVNNVQAIVARSSAKPLSAVLLFKLGQAAPAKKFLRDCSVNIPAGAALEAQGQPALHLMFSWKALEILLAGRANLDLAKGRKEFEAFFVDPVQAPDGQGVVRQLGFIGVSSPKTWWDGKFASGDIDLAVHASFDTAEQKSEQLARLRQSARDRGLQELALDAFDDGALSGFRPPDGRLHFGYRDGITAPNIDWNDTRPPNSVNLREFVVGYPNDDYPTAPQNPGAWQDFARDGSFVGISWVHQDVAAFNKFLQDNAGRTPQHVDPTLAEEWIAAKLMGRWRHGSPLMNYPDVPPPTPQLNDNFGYATDPDGIKCPVTAHIRVANSRDQSMKFANQVRFPNGPPRVIRRGFSYGPALQGVHDDGKNRGVVGLFFFARINEQFYTILRWMQKTEFSNVFKKIPNGFNAQDALIGSREDPSANTKHHIPLPGGDHLTLQLIDFLRYKGVVVLFAPSMAALQTLAAD